MYILQFTQSEMAWLRELMQSNLAVTLATVDTAASIKAKIAAAKMAKQDQDIEAAAADRLSLET